MKLLIELTKSNLDLAELEAVRLLKLFNIKRKNNFLIASTSLSLDILKNKGRFLAYARRLFYVFDDTKGLQSNKFRYISLGPGLNKFLIDRLISKGYQVDLSESSIGVTSFEGLHWILLCDIKDPSFQLRRNHLLPFSTPTSMHPRLARSLVNICASEYIYDPFAGSGGILIEAGLCNLKIFGAEIDPIVYEGLCTNLKKFNLIKSANILCKDGFENFKGFPVVTDVPYGKSSKVTGRNYESKVLKTLNPSVAVICTHKADFEIPKNYELKAHLSIYIHSSLTRHVYLFLAQSSDICEYTSFK